MQSNDESNVSLNKKSASRGRNNAKACIKALRFELSMGFVFVP